MPSRNYSAFSKRLPMTRTTNRRRPRPREGIDYAPPPPGTRTLYDVYVERPYNSNSADDQVRRFPDMTTAHKPLTPMSNQPQWEAQGRVRAESADDGPRWEYVPGQIGADRRRQEAFDPEAFMRAVRGWWD